MIRKHIWRNALALCSALLLAFSQPLSVMATEPTAETSQEERLEPDAYFEPVQSNAVEGWPQGPAVWAESAVVMDIDSGAFLYSKNMDTAKYPASITKVMTTLLAIENSQLNERVTFSSNAIFGIERNSSHIGIRVGEILSMEECLYGMMLASANEVCLAVAEHIAGSVDGFVEMMNQKAIELGCTNTHFTNPNGLPDEQHYTTAHDMALIAQAAYENPIFRKVCQTEVSHIPTTNLCGEERWFQNHHKMLLDGDYHYEGCTGGKTGYTMAALNTLVTYAEREGRRLLCVTFRTEGRQVYTDTASLLDYGFNNFQNITLYDRGTNAATEMLYPSIYFGHAMTIDKLRSNCTLTIPASATQDQISYIAYMTNGVITHDYQYHQYSVGKETVSAANIISLMKAGAGMESIDTAVNGPTIEAKSVNTENTVTPAQQIVSEESAASPTVTETPATPPTVTEAPSTAPTITEVPSTAPTITEVPTTNPTVTGSVTIAPDKTATTDAKTSFIETIQSITNDITTFDYASFAKHIPAYIYVLLAFLIIIVIMEIYFVSIYIKRKHKRKKSRQQRQQDKELSK